MDPSKQRLGQSLPASGEAYKDASIRHIEAKIKEIKQVLVVNNLKMPTHKVGKVSFEVRVVWQEAAPRGGSKEKRALSYYD